MPRKSILHNAGFRIAILDTTRKTAEIAVTYGISESNCRYLRLHHGRPWQFRARWGSVSSGDWKRDKMLLHDIQHEHAKTVINRYGLSTTSVLRMRYQVGAAKKQVLTSPQFLKALRTDRVSDIAEAYGIATATVSHARKRLGIFKPSHVLSRNPKFVKDTLRLEVANCAKKWRCTLSYVYLVRKRARDNELESLHH